MSDFINKVVAITLAFAMMIIGPLLLSYKMDEMIAKRLILNDVQQFIDKVSDTASVTEDDLNRLYIACNSHGLAVDVKVKRLIRTDTQKNGKVVTLYYAVDSLNDLQSFNAGDIVKVTVTEVGISTYRRLFYNILKIDEGKFEFSLAGRVG